MQYIKVADLAIDRECNFICPEVHVDALNADKGNRLYYYTLYLMLISSDLIGQSGGRQFWMSYSNVKWQLCLINECWNLFQKRNIRYNKINIIFFTVYNVLSGW